MGPEEVGEPALCKMSDTSIHAKTFSMSIVVETISPLPFQSKSAYGVYFLQSV